MHVILGALGSIVTILWLLHRLAEMGIDLAGLNPFLWQRRRRWRKQYESNPIFKISSPMEATALLVTATAKADGDISSEEKRGILDIFEKEFHLSKSDAAGLLVSSAYLLRTGEEVRDKLPDVLAPSLDAFTGEQAGSALELMTRIANVGSPVSEMQRDLIEHAGVFLQRPQAPKDEWS